MVRILMASVAVLLFVFSAWANIGALVALHGTLTAPADALLRLTRRARTSTAYILLNSIAAAVIVFLWLYR